MYTFKKSNTKTHNKIAETLTIKTRTENIKIPIQTTIVSFNKELEEGMHQH